MKPTRGIFGGVCAPTANGHAAEAAVALPKSAMKSRRFIAPAPNADGGTLTQLLPKPLAQIVHPRTFVNRKADLLSGRCLLSGQSRKLARLNGMSALASTAAIAGPDR